MFQEALSFVQSAGIDDINKLKGLLIETKKLESTIRQKMGELEGDLIRKRQIEIMQSHVLTIEVPKNIESIFRSIEIHNRALDNHFLSVSNQTLSSAL